MDAGHPAAVPAEVVQAEEPLASLRGHDGAVRCVASCPDGRLFTGSADCSIRVWNANQLYAYWGTHKEEQAVLDCIECLEQHGYFWPSLDLTRVWALVEAEDRSPVLPADPPSPVDDDHAVEPVSYVEDDGDEEVQFEIPELLDFNEHFSYVVLKKIVLQQTCLEKLYLGDELVPLVAESIDVACN